MAIQSRLFRYENETPMDIIPYTIRGPERRVPTTRGGEGELIIVEERSTYYAQMAAAIILANSFTSSRSPRRIHIVECYYPIFELGFHLGIWPVNNYDASRFQIVVYRHINN